MKYLLVIISSLLLFLPAKVCATAGINNTITLQGKVTNTDGTNVTDGAYGFEFKVYNGASSGATSLFTENWSTAALFSSTMSTAPGAGGETLVYSGDTNESSFKVGQILWNITKGEPVTITSVTTGTNTLGISPTRQAWATSDTITNQIYVKDGIFRVAINSLNQDWGTIDFGDDSLYVGINFNTDGEMLPRLRFSSVPYSMTASNALNLGGIAATGYLRSNTSDTFETGNTLTVAGDIDINGQISIADTDIVLDGATTNLSATGDFSINTDDLFVNKSTGNVAIGSASPGTAKLHVTGDIVATGTITAATNETINGIDISSGTISDATWNGSIIAAQYGGTGANLSSVAQYSVPYFSATGILGGAVAPGTTGYVLATNSTGGAPSWVSADAIAPYQWRLVDEQLSPTNAAVYDVMIGGIATATATISLQANTGAITGNKLYIRDTNASNTLNINWNENDTADRTLNIALGNGDRYLTLNRSLTVGGTQDGSLTYSAAAGLTIAGTSAIDQDVQTTANPSFAGVNADSINLGITGAGVIDTDSGNLILATTTDIGSSTTGLRVDTDGNLVDIDDAAVTFGESVAVTGSVTASTTLTAGLVATYDPITISPVVKGTNAYTGTITSEDLTAAHTWEFPNKDGIVAMMSDVTGAAHNAVTLAAIGSSPNANGMTLSTQVLNLEPASVNFGGVVTTGTQSFAGDKTFTGAFVLGDHGDLGSIDTSDWDVSTTGDLTGIGGITADGAISFTPSSTNDITFNVDTDTLLTLDSSVTNADTMVISPYNSGSNTYTGTLTSTDLTGNVTWTLPNATSSLMGNPMTTQGDIIYGGSSGTPTRLAGSVTDNLVLKYDTDTGVPFWGVDENSGTTYTAGNGLDLATAEFQLGGNLTKNTTITQDSAESLSFVNAGTANTIFNLSSSGDMVIQDNGTPFATFTDTGTFILDSLTLDGTSLTSSAALGLSSAAGSDLTLTSRGNSFTLPTTAGSNGFLLSTDGSGTLGWTNPATLGGSGSLFTLTDEQIHPINLAFDLLLGNTATSTATIALQANTGAATVNALFIRDSNASNTMHLNWNENDTANRTLNLALGTGDRYLTLNEDFTIGDGFAGSLTYTTATSLTVEAASYLNQDLTTDASPTFAGATLGAITVGVSDDNTITTSTGALTLTPAAGSNLNITLSGTGDLAVNTNDLYVDTSTGYVGIGTNDPQAQLDVYGTTSTLTNSAGDITIDAYSNEISFANDSLKNITNLILGGQLQVGNYASNPTAIGAGSIIFNTTSETLQCYDGTAWVECSGDILWQVNGDYIEPVSAAGVSVGEVVFVPQTSTTSTNEGTVYYDSDVDHLYVYGGDSAYHRLALDLTKYASSAANIANEGYVEVAHNQNTSDMTLIGWIKNTLTGLWEKITDKSITYTQNLQNQWDDAISGSKIRTQTRLTNIELQPSVNVGTGADGAITVSSSSNINTTNLISGRSCVDGGDAVNYSVTALTSNTATLSTAPSLGCLAAGDEILLVNLAGTATSLTNLGVYETLRISSISTNTITFITSKIKNYGDNATDDSNIGTTTNTQRVMLQRIPNYTNVTINSTYTLYPSSWNGAKGGVIFFRANGTVSSAGTISSSGYGYSGGTPAIGAATGGESTHATNGGGSGSVGATAATNGTSGGGGGGGYSSHTGATGSSSFGGAGGGGGGFIQNSVNNFYGAGGGGGGHVTYGYGGGGAGNGSNGSTDASGDGGSWTSGYTGSGGGGGGTYYASDTTRLILGAGGGAGGSGNRGSDNLDTAGGAGGVGGGIIVISANTITVSGSISSSGANGGNQSVANTYTGGGGGGAGGTLELKANSLTIGESLVTATGGTGGTGQTSTYNGGSGGSGRTGIYYTNSYSGSTSSPTPTYTQQPYYPYGLYHSPIINTPNATTFDDLRWESALNTYGKASFQTRSGPDPTLTELSSDANTIGLWHLNETTENSCSGGQDACDSSSNSNHATATGTSIESTNVRYGARSRFFDHDSDYLDAGDIAAVDSATSLSSCAWVYHTSDTTDNYITNKGDTTAGFLFLRDDVGSNSGRTETYKIYVADSADTDAANIEGATNAAPLNTWNHVCFTFTANNSTGLRLYVNGKEDANSPASTVGISAIDAGTNTLRIGSYYNGTNSFHGYMDEVIITNDVLTDAEINTMAKFWEAWRPMAEITNYVTLESADAYIYWTGTNATVATGNVTRNVDMFEDEDEGTASNTTKFVNTSAGTGYMESDSMSSTDISGYDYLTAWVYATASGNTVKIGFGESAATEQEELITIDAPNTWQKIYWDLSDIPASSRDEVNAIRVTNLNNPWNTIHVDNIRAEKVMTTSSGTKIESTPNNYFQYRAILTTTNTAYQPQVENISFNYNNGFKTVQTDANTVRLYNYSGSNQEIRLDAIVFGADLAEWYSVENPDIGPGDIVALTGFLDDYSVPILRKATKESGSNIVGVISTKAGQTLGLESPERRLLGLAGRVPVKMASDSGRILPGDFLTASDIPGMAKSATWGNMIIGKALEPWSADSGKSTVLMLINDPAPYFPILTKTIDQVSSVVEGITLLTNVVIDNLTINSKLTSVSIDTDQFSAGTASISGLIAGTIDVATLSAKTINSPVLDGFHTDLATLSSRLTVLEAITSPDARLTTLESQLASLSALVSPQPLVETNLELPLTSSDSALIDALLASSSASLSPDTDSLASDLNLDVESIFVSDFLSVLGDTILTTATITNSLTVSSITSLSGNLSLMGNLLTLDSTGNLVTITGNLIVTGDLSALSIAADSATISGTLIVDTIYNKQLEQLASQSAQLMSQVASISSVLGLATSSATPISPSVFAAPTPRPATRSADLPMTLEEFLVTQSSP